MLKKSLQRFTGPVFFLLGLFLLFLLIRKFGVDELFKTFQHLGWEVVLVLCFPLCWYLVQTAAWYFTVEETGSHVSFRRLLAIKLAGESVNTLTPVSWMGGDPVRILMLRKDMPGTLSTASTVLDRTMQSLAIVLFVMTGLIVAWIDLDMPRVWTVSFPFLVLLMGLLVWFFIHRQKKGVFRFLSSLLDRLGLGHHVADSWQKKIGELDERISLFYRHDHKRFFSVLLFHFLGRVLGIAEIWLIGWILDMPLSWEGSLFLATLSILVNMVFVFIPGSMGVMEGAYGALFALLGLSPVSGVALQLVRRLRTIFWIGMGLVMMTPVFRSKKKLVF